LPNTTLNLTKLTEHQRKFRNWDYGLNGNSQGIAKPRGICVTP